MCVVFFLFWGGGGGSHALRDALCTPPLLFPQTHHVGDAHEQAGADEAQELAEGEVHLVVLVLLAAVAVVVVQRRRRRLARGRHLFVWRRCGGSGSVSTLSLLKRRVHRSPVSRIVQARWRSICAGKEA